MPSACEVLSFANSAFATASASCCACAEEDCCSVLTSLPRKLRRPLLRKCSDTLRVIRGTSQLPLRITLGVQLLIERPPPALINSLLGAGQSLRRRRSQLARQRIDHPRKLRILDATPDEAPLRRLLGAQLVAQKREPHRPSRPDQPRQKPGAPRVRHQPELRKRLDETR